MQKIERIKCGNGNCYLIVNGENAVLVDTSRFKHKDRIVEACKKYNVRLIVLTHGHIDHVQNAAYLSEKLGAPIAMHRADIELIKDNLVQELQAKTWIGKGILALSIKSFKEDPLPYFEPQIFLEEGDSLIEYAVHASVIALPGHTKGSIALRVEDVSGIGQGLIVGDALMNMFSPTASLLYNEYNHMIKSVSRLNGFVDSTIFFGHGKPVRSHKI